MTTRHSESWFRFSCAASVIDDSANKPGQFILTRLSSSEMKKDIVEQDALHSRVYIPESCKGNGIPTGAVSL